MQWIIFTRNNQLTMNNKLQTDNLLQSSNRSRVKHPHKPGKNKIVVVEEKKEKKKQIYKKRSFPSFFSKKSVIFQNIYSTLNIRHNISEFPLVRLSWSSPRTQDNQQVSLSHIMTVTRSPELVVFFLDNACVSTNCNTTCFGSIPQAALCSHRVHFQEKHPDSTAQHSQKYEDTHSLI